MLVDATGEKINDQFTIIPLDFIKAIPYEELCLICRRLAIGVVNNEPASADRALLQLMMEIDMAGKIINLKADGKHEEAEKIIKEQNKRSRDAF
jgi:hypothetical protein